jgi:hypothetical protein
MQNLRKLSILTITFLCANYFSTMAQDEQKAFKEGDKVFSVGIAGGFGSSGYSKLTPSFSFDYGLKGTRGIVSIGGFLSYSNTNYGNYISGYSGVYQYYNQPVSKDSVNYSVSNYSKYNQHTITAGLRLGLHYATRKWDLYAGALVGYQVNFTDSRTQTTDYYKGTFTQYGGYPQANGKLVYSETNTSNGYNYGQMILSPYIGARYYVSPKVSLNLEIGQHTGNIGVGFKF